MPYAWPAPPNRTSTTPNRTSTGPVVESHTYIQYLASTIRLSRERLREMSAEDRILTPAQHILGTYIQELGRVIDERRPEVRPLPLVVQIATALRQLFWDLTLEIEDLQARIEDPYTATEVHHRYTLDRLRNELRKATREWDQLPPIHGLPPPVRSSRGGGNFNRFLIPNSGTAADTRVNTVVNNDYSVMMGSRGDLNSPNDPVVRTSATTRDRFGELFQGHHPTRRLNLSFPPLVPPQTHGEANHAVTEDLTTGDGTSVGPVSGEELGGGDHGTIAHGTGTDASSDPNPTSVDEVQPDTRDPVAAAPPRSPPHGDADLECPDLTPDIGSEEDEMEIDEVSLIHDHDGDGDGSAASRSYLQATAARALASMGPVESGVDDALDEELYGDGY